MFLMRFLRFIRGYVYFRAWEGFPERFLNLCSHENIPIWNVTCKNAVLCGCTTIEGYKAMRGCAKKSGCRSKVIKKVGMPFFLHKYRRRVGLLAGFCVFLVGLAFLSQMVWTISVVGCQSIPEETVRNAFAEQGLQMGILQNRINTKKMAADVAERLPGISWVTLNLRGSVAEIVIREIVPEERSTNGDKTPVHIVAAKDGLLQTVEVYQGQREARAGQAVSAGDLIASGIVDMDAEKTSTRMVHADAYAAAKVNYDIRATTPRIAQMNTVGKVRTSYTLKFLWFSIPLGFRSKQPANAITLQSANTFSAKDKVMPLAIERTTYIEQIPNAFSLGNARLELKAAQTLFDAGYAELSSAKVLKQTAALRENKEGAAVLWSGSAIENIGVQKVIG
jgi:similar to stage IV sporulation protein